MTLEQVFLTGCLLFGDEVVSVFNAPDLLADISLNQSLLTGPRTAMNNVQKII